MNRDELIAYIRKGSRIRVDDVLIHTPNHGDLQARGIMETDEEPLTFKLRLAAGLQIPKMVGGFLEKKDFWSMEGIIEDVIRFKVPSMPPLSGSTSSFGGIEYQAITVHSNYIEIEPDGGDALTYGDMKALLRKAEAKEGVVQEPEEAEEEKPIHVTFLGMLTDYPLYTWTENVGPSTNHPFTLPEHEHGGKILKGTLGDAFTFQLINEATDAEFYLESTANYVSPSEEEDRRHLHAFLAAIAFTHGKHAYPFLTRHRRDGRICLDRIRAPEKLNATEHKPFDSTMDYGARTKKISWELAPAIDLLYRFFLQETPFTKDIGSVIFRAREAAFREIPPSVSAPVLCSLFENLIRRIAEEYNLLVLSEDFEAAKQAVLKATEALQTTDSARSEMYGRFLGSARSLGYSGAKEICQAVFTHLRLPWEGRWEETCQIWKKYRNKAHHDGHLDIEASAPNDMTVESRVAGMINALVLSLAGYEGIARVALYEKKDNYQSLKKIPTATTAIVSP